MWPSGFTASHPGKSELSPPWESITCKRNHVQHAAGQWNQDQPQKTTSLKASWICIYLWWSSPIYLEKSTLFFCAWSLFYPGIQWFQAVGALGDNWEFSCQCGSAGDMELLFLLHYLEFFQQFLGWNHPRIGCLIARERKRLSGKFGLFFTKSLRLQTLAW